MSAELSESVVGPSGEVALWRAVIDQALQDAVASHQRGRTRRKLMDVSRHKLVETLRGYVRRAEEFDDHVATGLL